MKASWIVSSLFLSLTFIGSVSSAEQHFSPAAHIQAAQDTITVVDSQNQPIAGASVLLGYDATQPTVTTGADGKATLPSAWGANIPVTVSAAGFITTTYPMAFDGSMTVSISKQEGQDNLEVSGTCTDFGRLVQDGNVDFGLVMPAIGREQLLGFDLSLVLSPEVDVLSILGQNLNIPSNISLPTQTESYIFPVTLDKPVYRTYLREKGTYDIAAMHGKFPLSDVIDDLQAGKSIFELVNYFSFSNGGIKSTDVEGAVANNDIAVNQMPLNNAVNVNAPTIADNQVMVSLPMIEQNGKLIPTDIKRFLSGDSMALKTTGSATQVLSLLLVDANAGNMMPAFVHAILEPFRTILPQSTVHAKTTQDFSQLSLALQPVSDGMTPAFLPLIDKPTVEGSVIKMTPPALPTGLTAAGTYVVYTEMNPITHGSITTNVRTRLWQVVTDGWVSQVQLPNIQFQKKSDRTYRWEVMYMARPTNFSGATTPQSLLDLSGVTHLTRNALDL